MTEAINDQKVKGGKTADRKRKEAQSVRGAIRETETTSFGKFEH